MAYLDSLTIKDESALPAGFPFELPVIEVLESIEFTAPVTFFVGENGSGKSTLLEAIACGMNCPTVGQADVNQDPLLAGPQALARQLRFSRKNKPRIRLFFRAEDAIGFTRRVNENLQELKEMEEHYDDTLDGYARQLATGAMRNQQNALSNRYGEDLDARSHGEWFLNVLRERIHPNGLYLLDEPETPLSPVHQLSLISIVQEATRENCQFIIATHSPILMALPGAMILEFSDYGIREQAWDDVDHVAITRAFLNDPESYLRHL